MGFVFGLLLGAIGALLYAPKAGDGMRGELQARADELKRRADDLQRIAQKIADDVSVKGREIIDDAKKEWDSAGTARSTGAAGSRTAGSGGTGGTGTSGGAASKS
ncbi:MAG TPA: YtxH domain-containing protein [Candidatus Limnocylindria bacterium]|nr:YtxH domain-containing protein [Candidatus Limnocylindria bacterium]